MAATDRDHSQDRVANGRHRIEQMVDAVVKGSPDNELMADPIVDYTAQYRCYAVSLKNKITEERVIYHIPREYIDRAGWPSEVEKAVQELRFALLRRMLGNDNAHN